MRRIQATFVAATLLTWTHAAGVQENILTLDGALTLARARAPALLSARAQVEEARGRLRSASVLAKENPFLEGAVGRRSPERADPREDSTDLELTLGQNFELGGKRGARIAAARAGLAREIAGSDNALRLLVRDVAGAFARSLAEQERLRLTAAAEKVAADLLYTAERRYRAGDIAALEMNLARIAAARARSEALAAEADLVSSLNDLRILLGMGAQESLTVAGDLRERRRYELSALLARLEERPDLKALEAEMRQAREELRLARGLAWPDLGFRVGYEREENDEVLRGGLALTLPLIDRGRGQRAEAEARERRLHQELGAARRAAEIEVKSAFEVYRYRVSAVEALEKDALPSQEDNETLARRSFEAGELSLVELLLIRRESLETRNAYVASLLDAALQGVELDSRAGVLR